MLLTDSDIIGVSDLSRLDSEVVPVAATASPPITVDGPGSVCENAWSECASKVLASMQSYVSYPAQTGMPASHMAAVTNVGIPARTQPRVRLNQIVAGDPNYSVSQAPFQTWMIYHALAMFYRDASARMQKDRYKDKYERYERVSEAKWRTLRNNGLPMVYQPMEAPGAKHAFRAGPWAAANVTASAGGTNAATQQVLVAITWYDATKYTSRLNPPYGDLDPQHNAESAGSAQLSFVIPVDGLLTVNIASLSPPTGNPDPVGLSAGTWTPLNASNWNIYVGQVPAANVPATLYLQQEGIPIGTQQFTLAADPIYSGPVLTLGQYPDLNLVFLNVAMRG
jgi:hypothetical protein